MFITVVGFFVSCKAAVSSRHAQEGSNPGMTEFVFTCPECLQEIEINEQMREAILENGCPVCTATVTREDIQES